MVVGSDMIDSELILVPASCPATNAGESITLHPPGEDFVILKTVQTLSYHFLPMSEVFIAGPGKHLIAIIKKIIEGGIK